MAGIHNALAGAFLLGRSVINLTISSNVDNYNIRTAANSAGYVAGMSDITVTVNSGVVVRQGMYTGSFTTGDTLQIVNNGTIRGSGGYGTGAWYYEGGSGTPGGVALTLSYPTTIRSYGIIGGGGGGGGGGSGDGYNWGGYYGGGGGSGAGNASWDFNYGQTGGNSSTGLAGGTGGAAGISGGNGGASSGYPDGGGGGGGGLGGSGGAGGYSYFYPGGAGGAAGACTSGAGTYATWVVTGTRYGTIG